MSEPHGTRCFCPCHTNPDIVHVQACCCHHGYKRGTCTLCDRKKLSAAKVATDPGTGERPPASA